jgi:hypothetical protein
LTIFDETGGRRGSFQIMGQLAQERPDAIGQRQLNIAGIL